MRFLTYKDKEGVARPGLLYNHQILDLRAAADAEGGFFPLTLELYIQYLEEYEADCQKLFDKFKAGNYVEFAHSFDEVTLLAPISRPASCRDGYAFRQHVASARRNRGVEMIPEFDQYPIFYFTNHNAITGPGPVLCMQDHFQQLDFELECAVIIGKRGRNIDAKDADSFIFGYTIMNDWSARCLQMEEMKLNLGPAKGKDFATSIGPFIITPDELQAFEIPPQAGHIGKNHNLAMRCQVNGIEVSAGNLGDMHWTFAEIIERCAYGADILPTDVIGSGTVGTGCFLELNGTAKLNDPNAKPQWLEEGDVVELEIEQFGILKNIIVKEGDFSILAKKKTS